MLEADKYNGDRKQSKIRVIRDVGGDEETDTDRH